MHISLKKISVMKIIEFAGMVNLQGKTVPLKKVVSLTSLVTGFNSFSCSDVNATD